uniref:Lcl C-terminal domain-containing protein n=1 Tax=Mariniflexile sp. TaxID=1979402 RepID=UPI0040476E6D
MKPIIYNIKIVSLFATIILAISCKSDKTSKLSTNENSYVQVATGQISLYNEDGNIVTDLKPTDSLFGQDANYLKGKKMAYQNNGDGAIKDLNTGLVWQEIPTSEGFDWQGAKEYCENLELGGYDDWRMPTAKELFSISDFREGWPYLDTTYFSLVNNENVDKSEQYWTSNKYVGHTEEGQYTAAFGVNHATGHIKAYPGEAPTDMKDRKGPQHSGSGSQGTKKEGQEEKGNRPPPPGNGERPMGNPMLKHVRAVRGAIYGTNVFVDNSNKTITDNATGLMWSKNDSGKGLNWKNALTYAENSELAGYTDWRLPNVKELEGIVDYSFAPDAKDVTKDKAAIDPVFNCSEISNENRDKDYPYFWSSTSAHFQKGKPYYYAWYVSFGRAVNNEGLDFHGAGAVRFDTKHENGPASEGGERLYNYARLVRNID